MLTKSNFKSLKMDVGQSVAGTVSRVIDNTTVMIEVNDKQLAVKVYPQNSLSPGDTVLARVEQVENNYIFVIQKDPALKVIDPSMIKPYMVAKQPFGEMMEKLQELVINSPILKELGIDPELLKKVEGTVNFLLSRDIPDEKTIKNQIAQSGINYEAKVKRLFAENPEATVSAAKSSLSGDLKGLLLRLGKDVEKAVAEGDKILSPAQSSSTRSVPEVLQSIKQATDNIELNQLTNQFAKQEHQPIVLQIPYLSSSDGKTVKLYVKDSGGEGKKSQGDKQNYSLVFLLNLTVLGHLRIDTQVSKDQLSIKIGAESQAVAEFIQAHTEELKTQLQKAGFKAEVSCSKQLIEEMQGEECLVRLLVKDPSRLVDVKT